MHHPMEATHVLESQGQVSSAGSNPAHYRCHSLTGEPKTGVVSRIQMQLTMEATCHLENQGQALSAGSKSCSPWKPLTDWRSKAKHHQQGRIQLTTDATHSLESRRQALSAGFKSSSPRQPLTDWTGIVSRVEKQHGMAATHPLQRKQRIILGQPFCEA